MVRLWVTVRPTVPLTLVTKPLPSRLDIGPSRVYVSTKSKREIGKEMIKVTYLRKGRLYKVGTYSTYHGAKTAAGIHLREMTSVGLEASSFQYFFTR
jgi:hypothetical protein